MFSCAVATLVALQPCHFPFRLMANVLYYQYLSWYYACVYKAVSRTSKFQDRCKSVQSHSLTLNCSLWSSACFEVVHVCVASTGEEVWHLNCDRIVRENPTLVQSLPAGSLDAKTKRLSPDNRDLSSKCLPASSPVVLSLAIGSGT